MDPTKQTSHSSPTLRSCQRMPIVQSGTSAQPITDCPIVGLAWLGSSAFCRFPATVWRRPNAIIIVDGGVVDGIVVGSCDGVTDVTHSSVATIDGFQFQSTTSSPALTDEGTVATFDFGTATDVNIQQASDNLGSTYTVCWGHAPAHEDSRRYFVNIGTFSLLGPRPKEGGVSAQWGKIAVSILKAWA